MATPEIPRKTPYPTEVQAGRSYSWCSCGKRAKQPFCDGSYQGTEFTPLYYTTEKDGKVFFCGGKQSKKGTLCDGPHSRL